MMSLATLEKGREEGRGGLYKREEGEEGRKTREEGREGREEGEGRMKGDRGTCTHRREDPCIRRDGEGKRQANLLSMIYVINLGTIYFRAACMILHCRAKQHTIMYVVFTQLNCPIIVSSCIYSQFLVHTLHKIQIVVLLLLTVLIFRHPLKILHLVP